MHIPVGWLVEVILQVYFFKSIDIVNKNENHAGLNGGYVERVVLRVHLMTAFSIIKNIIDKCD